MDQRMRGELDRHITGNYGEDQPKGDDVDENTEYLAREIDAALDAAAEPGGRQRAAEAILLLVGSIRETLADSIARFATAYRPNSTGADVIDRLTAHLRDEGLLPDETPLRSVPAQDGGPSA